MTALRTSVLGSGSVGLAIAATYVEAGQNVTLLARRLALPEMKRAGITVSGVLDSAAIGQFLRPTTGSFTASDLPGKRA